MHEAIPESASEQVNAGRTTSLRPYSWNCGLVIVAVGRVASRFTSAEREDVPPSLVTVHVYVLPGVSAAMTAVSHPDVAVTAVSSSIHAQYSVTSRLNQPFSFGLSLSP